MEPKQPNKQKLVSSLYDGVLAPAKGKNDQGWQQAPLEGELEHRANRSSAHDTTSSTSTLSPRYTFQKKTVPTTKSTHASSSASVVSDLSIDV
jgi:hypothetical protein